MTDLHLDAARPLVPEDLRRTEVDISPSALNPPMPHLLGTRISLRPSAGDAGSSTSMPALDRLPHEQTVYLSLGTAFNAPPRPR